jgi:drug/metabolite transporter (DMT)-like permease
VETALLTTLEAPLAPFWVWLALGQAPEAASLAGGVIVLAAVIVHVLRQAARDRRN